jgi:excisionase family DNA binding protein
MAKLFIPNARDIKVASMIVKAVLENPKEKLVLLIDGKEFTLSDQMTKAFLKIVSEISKGESVAIEALDTQMTTQEAADYLGYSRPTLIKLLDEYDVEVSKVGRHRRISFSEVKKLQLLIQASQQQAIRNLQKLEVELGLLELKK